MKPVMRISTEQQRLIENKRHDEWEEKHYQEDQAFEGVHTRALEKNLKKKYK